MRNLEIKCHYPDLKRAEHIALDEVHAEFAGRLQQTDVYFNVPDGRLKLRHNRMASPQKRRAFVSVYELIFYQRPNQRSARTSSYQILPVADGAAAERLFKRAWGVKTRVHKSRRLLLQENLRIHLDSIAGLGKFLEFELIVSPSYRMARCRKRMRELIERFGIQRGDIVAGSYSDLIWP